MPNTNTDPYPNQDRYDASSNVTSFDSMPFSDVETNELFWLNTELTNTNHAFRKLNENQALNTKTQKVHNIGTRTVTYQKI